MTELLAKPSGCGQGHITLLIHLWLIVGMATCYSVFMVLDKASQCRALSAHGGFPDQAAL
jgi:hypothetical protein